MITADDHPNPNPNRNTNPCNSLSNFSFRNMADMPTSPCCDRHCEKIYMYKFKMAVKLWQKALHISLTRNLSILATHVNNKL